MKKFRLNHDIRSSHVRLIDAEGGQVGVVTLSDALKRAEEEGFDLAEIQPNADPPVARLLDWGKYQYEQSKASAKQHKAGRSGDIKGVRLGLKISDHDLQTKARRAHEFLADGNKVRAALRFRGREIARPELGVAVVRKFAGLLEDAAKMESEPAMQGREVSVIFVAQKGKQRAKDQDTQGSVEAVPDNQDGQD